MHSELSQASAIVGNAVGSWVGEVGNGDGCGLGESVVNVVNHELQLNPDEPPDEPPAEPPDDPSDEPLPYAKLYVPPKSSSE